MGIAGRLDDLGKPAWIALMVLSFIAWWPLGLACLFFLIGSGRMGCWSHRRWREHMERWHEHMGSMCGHRHGASEMRSSGNSAFDEYRAETLRRLEDEQREFKEFLDRLRHAKDKAEFEQFMADRGSRPPEGPAPQPES